MVKEYEKAWGKEIWIANNDKYCGKLLYIGKAKICSIHYHKNKDETFYVLKGKIFMEVDGVKSVLDEGCILRIKPGVKHRFGGLEESIMIEISTHHEEDDSYGDTQSGDMPKEIMERYL